MPRPAPSGRLVVLPNRTRDSECVCTLRGAGCRVGVPGIRHARVVVCLLRCRFLRMPCVESAGMILFRTARQVEATLWRRLGLWLTVSSGRL